MSVKPDDVPQWAWDKAISALPIHGAAFQYEEIPVSVSRAIMEAVKEERAKQNVVLSDLDAALCQFLNNASDEYDPRVWIPSLKRDFKRLANAYNECHVLGVMDLVASMNEIRKRQSELG